MALLVCPPTSITTSGLEARKSYRDVSSGSLSGLISYLLASKYRRSRRYILPVFITLRSILATEGGLGSVLRAGVSTFGAFVTLGAFALTFGGAFATTA